MPSLGGRCPPQRADEGIGMLCYDAVYLRCILPERCPAPVVDLNHFFPEKSEKATAGCGDVNRK